MEGGRHVAVVGLDPLAPAPVVPLTAVPTPIANATMSPVQRRAELAR